VNAVAAFFYDRKYLLDSHLTCVIDFKGTPSPKSTMDDGEDDAVKNRLVLSIEGTIHEDARIVPRKSTIFLCAQQHAFSQQQFEYRTDEPMSAP
jgi:hypothetical protein